MFRQACAIESAAIHNPNWAIYVLFASHVGLARDSLTEAQHITALRNYENIHFRNVDILTYDIY